MKDDSADRPDPAALLRDLNSAGTRVLAGVQVWETVPDHVFDAAHEVMLVDLSAA